MPYCLPARLVNGTTLLHGRLLLRLYLCSRSCRHIAHTWLSWVCDTYFLPHPCRYVLGEGIEKKAADLSADIEEQKKSFEEAAAKKAAAAPAEEEAPAAEAATEDKPAVQVLASLWVGHMCFGSPQIDVSA